MLSEIARHVRQQLVGYIALFVAMGGVSYAAVRLPAHSIGPKQLKNGAVGSKQLKNGSITPPKLAASTIALFKGQNGLTGPTGPQGPVGAQGGTGAGGKDGTNGKNGLDGTNGTNGATKVTVRSSYFLGNGGASCNPGEVATGGGVGVDFGSTYVYGSYPVPQTGTPTGWGARINNATPAMATGTVYVICASP